MQPPGLMRTADHTLVGFPNSALQIDEQEWAEYGVREPGLREFIDKYRTASLSVSCFEIRKDVGLGPENTFTDVEAFQRHIASPPDKLTQIQVIEVHELSAVGLQMIGSLFGIHLDFWTWITSDDAADGYWLHSHNEGKVLCFDLPGIEFYKGLQLPKKGLLKDGRLKHLSSLHRFYGDELSKGGLLDLFANRRVSVYLLRHNGLPVFIYFSEDCQRISPVELKLDPADRMHGVHYRSFYETLREARALDMDTFKGMGEDPVLLVATVQINLLLSWHHFAHRLQNDLEKLDDKLNDSNTLETVPLYLDRDIGHMLDRFAQQLEAHEGFVHYCMKRDMSRFSLYPGAGAMGVLTRVERNTQILQRRLLRLIKRVSGISIAMHNRLANQQARLAARQAEHSTEMARLQRIDTQNSLEQGRGVARLSLIATFYVPLSFAAALLSMDSGRPLWIYFAVAIPCTVLTVGVLVILNWMSGRRQPRFRLFSLMSLFDIFKTISTDESHTDVEELAEKRVHYSDENV